MKNPKSPITASANDFKLRLMAHPLTLGMTGALVGGAGKPVGEPRVDPTGTIQPFFDMTNAHPNGAPAAGFAIGAGAGLVTAVIAQRRQAKKYHEQQNAISRAVTLNAKILGNYKPAPKYNSPK